MKDTFEPFLLRPYAVAPHLLEGMSYELNKLYQHGIIEKGPATCFSPVFVRAKPDGKSVRLILDARQLNDMVTPKCHPLLTRPELHVKLACLKNVKFITALDVSQAFYSVSLDEESRKLLGLSLSNSVSYRLTRLPMGGTRSLQSWCEALDMVLRDLQHHEQVAHYADDIYIMSSSFEQHLQTLEEILERMQRFNLKLNLKKSQFCGRQTAILGFDFTLDKELKH